MGTVKRAHRTLRAAGHTVASIWNTYHRLRVSVLLLGLWGGAMPAIRSLPVAHRLIPTVVGIGVLTLIVGLAGGDLAVIIDKWRTSHWEALDEWDEAVTDTDSSPATVAAQLPDQYVHTDTICTSRWECGGKALVWGLPLGYLGLLGVGGLLLTLPTPHVAAYSPIEATVFIIAAFFGMDGGHELLHGLVAQVQGADISIGLGGGGACCEYSGALLSRRALIVTTAAPLLVLSVVAVGFMVGTRGPLFLLGGLILLFHTPMAGGDLAQIGRVLFHSADTYFYPAADNGVWVFHPETQDQQTVLARLDALIARLSAPLTLP
jgi:hypothetical protein